MAHAGGAHRDGEADRAHRAGGQVRCLHDAYLSVAESLSHAGWAHGVDVEIDWIDSEKLETDWDDTSHAWPQPSASCAGRLRPRGIEGKIKAANFARTHKMPYLGLCLGMQVAVIEFARNVLGLAGASSAEFEVDAPTRSST